VKPVQKCSKTAKKAQNPVQFLKLRPGAPDTGRPPCRTLSRVLAYTDANQRRMTSSTARMTTLSSAAAGTYSCMMFLFQTYFVELKVWVVTSTLAPSYCPVFPRSWPFGHAGVTDGHTSCRRIASRIG
jgi:hypothetical protein